MKALFYLTIRENIGILVRRFVLRLRVSLLKRNLALQQRLLLLINYQIRALDLSILQLGESVEDDDTIEYVERYFTERPQLECSSAAGLRNSDVSARLIEKGRESEEIKETLSIYFASKAYTFSFVDQINERDNNLTKARQYCPTTKLFEHGDVVKNNKLIVRRLKALRSELAERSALKFTVTIAHVTAMLTVTPALMFVVGLLYTNALLSAFGINASLFFNLGDYLATSVEQLQSVAITVALVICMYFVGIRDDSLRSKMEIENIERNSSLERYAFAVLVLAASVEQIVYSLKGTIESGGLIFLSCFISAWLASHISNNYLKNSFQGKTFLLAIFVFSSNGAVRCAGEIQNLKNGNWGAREETTIVFKKDVGLDASNLLVIRANSSYVFTIEKTTQIPIIIPKDQISNFKINHL